MSRYTHKQASGFVCKQSGEVKGGQEGRGLKIMSYYPFGFGDSHPLAGSLFWTQRANCIRHE